MNDRKRRVVAAAFSALVTTTPLTTVATVVMTTASPSVHAAFADEFNCDDSYLPCDGSNYDYLTGDVPPPSDPVYQESLDDPPDWNAMYAEPLGDEWWNSGGSLDG